MSKFSLVDFSIRRPKLVVWATVALTLLFLTQLRRDDSVYLQVRYEP